MLMTYVTSQSAVTARQIMLWEEKPVTNIAESEMYEGSESLKRWNNSPNMKHCRDQATKNMGVTIDNR
jgi:hypothetical protein